MSCYRCDSRKKYFDPETPELTYDVGGIDFVERGQNDKHVCITLFDEDDGYFWEISNFSSFWLDDMIDLLQRAKSELETNTERFEKDGEWGYKFKV